MISTTFMLWKPTITKAVTKKARLWRTSLVANRKALSLVAIVPVVLLSVVVGLTLKPAVHAATAVPGQTYMICDQPATYLTSPWTYHALGSGTQTYTVSQYQALTGYGTTLPPLPTYISAQGPAATAAIIFAPGSTANGPAYDYPETPLLYFFEGGAYGTLGFDTVSGDQFIGGSAPGFPEPQFDDGGGAAGINGQNGSLYYSGGASTLAVGASAGATTVTTAAAIPGYINWITFADGSTYSIADVVGTSVTLGSPLSAGQSSGSQVWANQTQPLAYVTTGAAQGGSNLTLGSSSVPMMQYSDVVIGDDNYVLSSFPEPNPATLWACLGWIKPWPYTRPSTTTTTPGMSP